MLRRYKLKNYNFRLVILLIAISIIGVLLIGSADSADQKKQAIGVVLGVVIMIIVSLLDYSWLLNFYWVLYIGNLMMLGVLYLGGSTAKNTFGATRWIQIGSFQFQPTELSKIFLIMFFAMFLMKHEEDLNTAKTIFTAIGLLIPPLVMIYRQPDLKNTITVMVLFCFMMYVAGLSYKVIAVVLVSGSALVLALLLVITQVNFQLPAALDKTIGYQLGRIQDWLSDDADNADGEWNTLHVKVVDDRVTVEVNGRTVTENVILENTCAPGEAAYASGAIELLGEGDAAEFRDFYLCELPATPVFELSPEERAEGYEVLFDGRSLHKWTGNTTNYVPQEGTIYVTASYGGKGNLYTVEEYGDFILRFEFRFLREGVNNGIGLRTPMGVDAAYHGMEIQILDHDAPIYKNLRVYQQHGSVYGIIPAKRIKFGELGTWNVEEIRAVGDRITVTVNGEVILDGDIREACQGHNVSEDGSKKNPYTVDHRNHPGLFNKKGHIGLLGHGAGIQFRNIRIKSLDAKTQNGK